MGGAICSINNQGYAFPVKDCFCQCTGPQCEYWAYFHRTGDGWRYVSQVGPSAYQGDRSRRWRAGRGDPATSPPAPSRRPKAFDEVCPRRRPSRPRQRQPLRPRRHASATATATVRPPQGQSPTPGRLRGEHDGGLARRLHAVALVGNRCDRIDPEWCACQRARSEAGLPNGYAAFHPGGDQCSRPDGAQRP